MPPNKVVSSGLEYGPTINNKTYISVYKHRGNGSIQHKSVWESSITPDKEYQIFFDADEHNWHDTCKHYWGILNMGNTILGQGGERICKFPCPTTTSDPWHGYPVSPRADGLSGTPPDLLVERWIKEKLITKELGRKIQKVKI